MSNLDVALASFWQLARHWKQGDTAKLELSCQAGSLELQLSAKLGHPDHLHFPNPPPHPLLKKKSSTGDAGASARSSAHTTCLTPHPPPVPVGAGGGEGEVYISPLTLKKKSPSQLCRQERRRQESISKKTTLNSDSTEKVPSSMTEKSNETNYEKQTEKQSAENESSSLSCDICDFSANSKIGLNLHMKKKHVNIDQLDGNTSLNSSENENEKPETHEANSEHIYNLKFNAKFSMEAQHWTWPQNKPPPPKVNHPQEGLGVSPRINNTDPMELDHICYSFKTGVKYVFEIV